MPTQISLICPHCQAVFVKDVALHRHDTEVRGRKRFFCSRTCADLGRQKRVDISCMQCGNIVQRNARTVRRQRAAQGHFFCSRLCAWASPARTGLMGSRRAALRAMPTINLTASALGYIAGIVDGEGSFNMSALRRRSINVQLSVANTDLRILEFCQQMTGIGSIVKQPFRKSERHRQQWVWTVCARNDLRVLLPMLIATLVAKAEQAKTLLEYCEIRAAGGPTTDRELELVAQVKRLNSRGRPVL